MPNEFIKRQLIITLKIARKTFGKDSVQTFKALKNLKVFTKQYTEDWEYYTLRSGSFSGRLNK